MPVLEPAPAEPAPAKEGGGGENYQYACDSKISRFLPQQE